MLVGYFGSYVPYIISSDWNGRAIFLLTYTEFKFDVPLTGYELYAVFEGTIAITVNP